MADILEFRPRKKAVVAPVETPEERALRLADQAIMTVTQCLINDGVLPSDETDPVWAKMISPARDMIYGAIEYKLGIDSPLSRAIGMMMGSAPKEPT